MSMIEKAKAFAKSAHRGQKRRNGEDYFEAHVQKVADYVNTYSFSLFPDHISTNEKYMEAVICAAYLHDTVEDCIEAHLDECGTVDCDLETIEELFGPRVRELVDALTKRPGERYYEAIVRIMKAGPMARGIKIADLTCNMADADKKEKESARYAKYELAKHLLGVTLD